MLRNLSDHERVYQLAGGPPQGWELLNGLQDVTLGPQAQHEIFLTVQIPPATPAGRYRLSLRAQSGSDFALGRAQIAVRARERLKLALASSELIVHPNAEKVLSLAVTNRGNVSARVTLAVTAAPVGWQFGLSESFLTLLPNQSKSVKFTIKPLSEAPLAPARFTIQALSSQTRDELSLTVTLSPNP